MANSKPKGKNTQHKPKTSISQAERVAILSFLNANPNAKRLLHALAHPSEEDSSLAQTLTPILQEQLHKARMVGIMIGWQSAFISAAEHCKPYCTYEKVMTYLQEEADKARAVTYMKENYDMDTDIIDKVYKEALAVLNQGEDNPSDNSDNLPDDNV